MFNVLYRCQVNVHFSHSLLLTFTYVMFSNGQKQNRKWWQFLLQLIVGRCHLILTQTFIIFVNTALLSNRIHLISEPMKVVIYTTSQHSPVVSRSKD